MPVPLPWRVVDRATDLGGKGSDRGGAAAEMGQEFHKTLRDADNVSATAGASWAQF